MLKQKISIILMVLVSLMCCTPLKSNNAGGGTTTQSSTSPVASSAAPLTIQITTQYEGTSTQVAHVFTETGTTSCTATDAAPNAVCSVAIPEAQLYYGTLNIKFSWLNSNCKLLFFDPYYYRASSAAGFLPSWETSALDCSANPVPAGCYGGAAPYLVTDFPKYTGYVYYSDASVTDTVTSKTMTLSSANSKHYGSNRLTTNDYTNRAVALNAATLDGVLNQGVVDGYVANSMVDYTFSCADDYDDPLTYTLQINITDVDTAGAGPNNRTTWKEF